MTDVFAIILPVVLPLLLSLIAWQGRKSPRFLRICLPLGTGAMLAGAIGLIHAVYTAGSPIRIDFGGWEAPMGISFTLDLFSAIMIVVASTVGFCGALFAIGEIGSTTWRKGYATFYFLLLAGINGAFSTNDLFNLFVWFEVMLMASFAMLVLGRRKYVFEGATNYVVINMVSSFFFLSGLGVLYGKTGHLNLDEVAIRLAGSGSDPIILSSMALLLIAFGIKAGVFPLYFWLPPAYPNTGFATAAVFGGLLTKVGVYALFRIFGGAFSFVSDLIGPLFLLIGAATMVAGVLGAASQFHNRRILSFHIVSQIGYIIMGVGLMTEGAFAAAIFYIAHHIIVKTNLFLVVGVIARTGRSERLEKLGGLIKASPILAFLFLIPALSLGGIPPLSGFFAKFLLLRELLREEAFIYAGIALAVGIVTLFSMTKIWGEAFWKDSPRPGGVERFRHLQLVPIAILAAITIAMGILVGPMFDLSEQAAAQIIESRPASSVVTQP